MTKIRVCHFIFIGEKMKQQTDRKFKLVPDCTAEGRMKQPALRHRTVPTWASSDTPESATLAIKQRLST